MNTIKSMRRTPSYYREIQGQMFGHWLVLERRANRGNKAYYLCRCSCGIEREVLKTGLEGGRTTNCGHIKKPKQKYYLEQAFKRWTKKEDELIKLWYPVNGSRYLLKVLKRSKSAIHHRAFILGVKNTRPKVLFFNPKKWHDWEVEALKKYYPIAGVLSCLPHIPDRSKYAMRIKAGTLGLRAYAESTRGNSKDSENASCAA